MRVDTKNGTYKYKRFMRDGSVEEKTGVVRNKKAKKEIKRTANDRRM